MTRADLGKDPADVAAMFDGVAQRYDVTNDVLSMGQDRRWRTAVVRAVDAKPGETVLDLAAGTGTSSEPFDYYSLLHTPEELLGLPTSLGAGSPAASMRATYHL